MLYINVNKHFRSNQRNTIKMDKELLHKLLADCSDNSPNNRPTSPSIPLIDIAKAQE